MKEAEQACGCGCGLPTNRDSKGQPRRFVHGHSRRGRGVGWTEQGYRFIQHEGRRRALHRVIVEQREGRELRPDEVVHHVDGNPLNNDSHNLVILTRSEHMKIHKRRRRRRWTSHECQRAVELYQAGMSIDEVARAISRPYLSTRDVVARAGCSRRPSETRALQRRASSQIK